MRTQWTISLFVVLAVFAVPALADGGLLCTTSGHACQTNGTIVAQRDGDITGNIFYANADFTDYVRVIDLNPQNPWTSDWMLDNQRGIGQPSVNFGHAMKNDILVVQICDQQRHFARCNGARATIDPQITLLIRQQDVICAGDHAEAPVLGLGVDRGLIAGNRDLCRDSADRTDPEDRLGAVRRRGQIGRAHV